MEESRRLCGSDAGDRVVVVDRATGAYLHVAVYLGNGLYNSKDGASGNAVEVSEVAAKVNIPAGHLKYRLICYRKK